MSNSRETALLGLLPLCGTPRLRCLDHPDFEVGTTSDEGTTSGYFHPVGDSISIDWNTKVGFTNGASVTVLSDEVGVLTHQWGLLLVGNHKGLLGVHVVDYPDVCVDIAHAVRSLMGLRLECCHGHLALEVAT